MDSNKVHFIGTLDAYAEGSCIQKVSYIHKAPKTKIFFPVQHLQIIFNLYQYMAILYKSEVTNRCILGYVLRALEKKKIKKTNQSCQIVLYSEAHLSQSHLPMKCTNMYLFTAVELPHTLQCCLLPSLLPSCWSMLRMSCASEMQTRRDKGGGTGMV